MRFTTLVTGVSAVFNCGSDASGLPQTLSVGFKGAKGLTSGRVMKDCMEKGVIVAAGSACDANKKEQDYSPILKEFGVGEEVGMSTLRVSCGFWNTEAEGELVGRTIGEVRPFTIPLLLASDGTRLIPLCFCSAHRR